MNHWLTYSILTLVVFGIWGFLPKIAMKHITARSALIWEVGGAVLVGLVIAMSVRFRPEWNWKGAVPAFFTGIMGTLGIFFFLLAMSKGKASVVVTLTALYPVITIFLVFLFLREPITAKQGLGILFAVMAMVLFSA